MHSLLEKLLKKRGIEAGIALGYKKREKDNDVEKVEIIGDVEGKNCKGKRKKNSCC